MSNDSSNNSGSTDLKQILDSVKQITQDFESLTVQLRQDKAMIATLIAKSPRTSDRNPMQPATTTSSVALQRVNQSVAKQNALGEQLLRDTAAFAEALTEWTTELEKRGHLRMPERSPPPTTFYVKNEPIDATDPLGTVRIIDEEDTFSHSDWSDQPIQISWTVTNKGAIVAQGSKQMTPRQAYGNTGSVGYATLAGSGKPGGQASFIFVCKCDGAQWKPNGWSVSATIIDPWGIKPDRLQAREKATDIPSGVDLGSGGGVSSYLYGILQPAQYKGRLYAQ